MKIIEKTLNYIKSISAEMITNAGSGHLGSSLGASTLLFALFKDHYNFDVSDTDFLNRDRLVLSSGHISPLYYTLLSLFGFDVSLQDLKNFRQFGSKTPGHPEYGKTEGVEASTGPLGQGVANAVGMAIAEKSLSERFNTVGFPIISNYTYCYVGDGELMEGVAQEACSLAGTLKLSKLILLYDCNDVTIDGRVSLSNKEDVAKKFKAMGWNVITVKKGNNYYSCTKAIGRAKKSKKPTIIIFKTIIGIGTNKEGTSAVHSYVLTPEELDAFKKTLNITDSFYIPSDVRELCMEATRRGKLFHENWNQTLAIYANSQPELYKELLNYFDKKKLDYEKILKNEDRWKGISTIEANSIILNEIGDKLSQVIGGCADVARSTKVSLNNSENFLVRSKRGRNLHYGVREHAMGAISNGIALYEDFIVFDSTFLAFSNYMIPALRMRALMKLPAISIFTHDSVYAGQDGPTHQPIEQIAQLRSIIGMNVFRPCDVKELLAAYKLALNERMPASIVLSVQNIPECEGTSFKDAQMGGYILTPNKKTPDIVIYSTGSEVALAQEAAKELSKKYEVSVVSFPCLEVFEKQSAAYKAKVLQKDAKLRVALEASNDNVWYRYLGDDDLFIGVNEYMQSCPGDVNYAKAGFTVKNIVREITNRLNRQAR